MQNIQDDMQISDLAFEKLRRELRVTRFFSVVSSILMICILVGGFWVCSKVKGYAEQIWPLVEELSMVDYDVLNETMVKLDDSLNAVDWEKMSEQLSALDIEAINEAIAGLDTEELMDALENVNAASDKLKAIGESLEPIKSFFGR